jgi:hypothetical protein
MSDATWEQELIINGNEEESEISIYTASKRIAEKLIKKGYTPDRIDTSSHGVERGWNFMLPRWIVALKLGKNYVRMYPKPKAKPPE